jgi:hypothetical protein
MRLKFHAIKCLKKNATLGNYTKHPNAIILDEFHKQYLKTLKENGSNRIILQKQDKEATFKNRKLFEYKGHIMRKTS